MEQEVIASYNDAQRTITMSKNDIVNVTTLNLSNAEIDDLKGLEVGEHEVDVTVTGNENSVTYKPKVSKVKILITEK